ncbi:hypothetical protein D3C81_2211830 [compost metagenome]
MIKFTERLPKGGLLRLELFDPAGCKAVEDTKLFLAKPLVDADRLVHCSAALPSK